MIRPGEILFKSETFGVKQKILHLLTNHLRERYQRVVLNGQIIFMGADQVCSARKIYIAPNVTINDLPEDPCCICYIFTSFKCRFKY